MNEAVLAVAAWQKYFAGQLSAREAAELLAQLHASDTAYGFELPDDPDAQERVEAVIVQLQDFLAEGNAP
jgi:aminoglycoside phosphotransferase (APT) family kinase protein